MTPWRAGARTACCWTTRCPASPVATSSAAWCSRGIDIPIIVVTAHDQPALREQCLADGAVAYLAKPLQRERLVGLINEALRARAANA